MQQQLIVTIFLVANVLAQTLAGVPDCIHANEGYAYPRPAYQLSEGLGAYNVAPSVATYSQGKFIHIHVKLALVQDNRVSMRALCGKQTVEKQKMSTTLFNVRINSRECPKILIDRRVRIHIGNTSTNSEIGHLFGTSCYQNNSATSVVRRTSPYQIIFATIVCSPSILCSSSILWSSSHSQIICAGRKSICLHRYCDECDICLNLIRAFDKEAKERRSLTNETCAIHSQTAPLSKVAAYTPTSNILSVPAVKTVAYPRITPGYLPPAPAYTASAIYKGNVHVCSTWIYTLTV